MFVVAPRGAGGVVRNGAVRRCPRAAPRRVALHRLCPFSTGDRQASAAVREIRLRVRVRASRRRVIPTRSKGKSAVICEICGYLPRSNSFAPSRRRVGHIRSKGTQQKQICGNLRNLRIPSTQQELRAVAASREIKILQFCIFPFFPVDFPPRDIVQYRVRANGCSYATMPINNKNTSGANAT